MKNFLKKKKIRLYSRFSRKITTFASPMEGLLVRLSDDYPLKIAYLEFIC